MTSSKYSFLFGQARFQFDNWDCSKLKWTIPFTDYKFKLHYPGFIFSSIFYIGLGASIYFLGKTFACLTQRFLTYFKRIGNSKKYLNTVSEKLGPTGSPLTYTAVIYGAGTKVGRAYAHFLAQKGFNLILVERETRSLDNLEVNLKADLLKEPLITKICLDRFDVDTFARQVTAKIKFHKDSPVKLFVNCKNSRRR